MTLFDWLAWITGTVLMLWAFNYSISAHFQEKDRDVWVQHGISAVFLLIAILLLVLTGA